MYNLQDDPFVRSSTMKTLLMTFFPNTRSKLTLTKFDFTWTNSKKEIIVQIKNIGTQNTGPIEIDFDLEKDIMSENSLPHITHTTNELKKDDSIDFTADFTSLSQPHNKYLADVNKIIIHVEGKTKVNIPIIATNSKDNNIEANKT